MKKKTFLIALITATLIAAVLNAYLAFYQNLNTHLRKDVEVRLHEIVMPNIISFDLQMQEQIKKVTTLADFLGKHGDLKDQTTLDLIKATAEHNGLLRCAIAFPDGSFITHDSKNEGNVSEQDFFKANMNGEFFITDPQPAVVDDTKTVLLFAAPIYNDEDIIGSVIYSYLCDSMDAIFNFRFLSGDGKMFIIKKDGTSLMGNRSLFASTDNVLTYLKNQCTHQFHMPSECMIISGESGNCTLTLEDSKSSLLVSYNQLSFNDWYMLSMVSETAAGETLSLVSKDQLNMGITIFVYASIYISVIFYFAVRDRNNIDKKTGLCTLKSFKKRARKIMSQSADNNFVILKLDVKNFKLINRVYDYSVGDQVIANIADSFRFLLDLKDCPVARVGTDDFLFLLPYHGKTELDQLRQQFIIRFRELMGPSFTTAVEFPTGQYILTEKDFPKPDIEEILEKVNFAHRAAKHRSLNLIVDYEENLEKEALLEKSIIDQMADALLNDEFCLFLQPKYHVQTETICGAEALVRWICNGRFYLAPIAFIPILEKNGFIIKLDLYMFKKTAEKLRQIIDDGKTPVPISVNFSICHLDNEDFVNNLCTIADAYELPHELLEVELTESAVFENVTRIKKLIAELHNAGFLLSMDDFGSGYSCLALLKDLDVDVIKLDKGFFDLNSDESRSRIVIANIINLAKELGIQVVAEGVEDKTHVEMLRELSCDVIQGYYYSKPLPADEFSL